MRLRAGRLSSPAARYRALERAALGAARRNGASIWYVGRDLDGVYTDTTGSALSAVGSAVGLLLDRQYQATPGTLGPNLTPNGFTFGAAEWTNGSDAGGSVSFSGNTLSLTYTSGNARVANNSIVFEPNKTYIIAVTSAVGLVPVYLGPSYYAGTLAPGVLQITVTPPTQQTGLGLRYSGPAGTVSLSGISVREVTNGRLGPELVSNGGFASGLTGWTDIWGGATTNAVESGELHVVSPSSASYQGRRQTLSTRAGAWYYVSADVRVISGFGLVDAVDSEWVFGGSASPQLPAGFNGRAGFFGQAVGSTAGIQVVCSTAGESYFDNVSAVEVYGSHASQATAGSRPTLVTLPSGYFGFNFSAAAHALSINTPPVANEGTVVAAGLLPSSMTGSNKVILSFRDGAYDTGHRNPQLRIAATGNLEAMWSGGPTFPGYALGAPYAGQAFSASSALLAGTASLFFNGALVQTAFHTTAVDAADSPASTIGYGALGGYYGALALIASSRVAMPDADRRAIERFGAFLAGAPFN